MAFDLNTQVEIIGGGSLTDSALGIAQGASLGAGVLPAVLSQYAWGTGAGQANAWYLARRTVAATTYDDINLSALSTLGTTFSLTKLKFLLVSIIDPNGTKELRVGPQGRSNAAQLWFGGTGATAYEQTFGTVYKDRPTGGWDVTASTADILSVYNPTGSTITYAVWVLGID